MELAALETSEVMKLRQMINAGGAHPGYSGEGDTKRQIIQTRTGHHNT